MFPTSHSDVVLPGLIYFAEKIVDEPLPQNLKYSFGSTMLSHTYRGLCDATQKSSFAKKAPLLLSSVQVSPVAVLGIPPCLTTPDNKPHTPIQLWCYISQPFNYGKPVDTCTKTMVYKHCERLLPRIPPVV